MDNSSVDFDSPAESLRAKLRTKHRQYKEQEVSQEQQEQDSKKRLHVLVHACACYISSCQVAGCRDMKKAIIHMKSCKIKSSGGCSICKKLVTLCIGHAQHCNKIECLVPSCSKIKQELKHRALDERLQQAELFKKELASIIKATPKREEVAMRRLPENQMSSNVPETKKTEVPQSSTQMPTQSVNRGASTSKYQHYQDPDFSETLEAFYNLVTSLKKHDNPEHKEKAIVILMRILLPLMTDFVAQRKAKPL